YPRGRLRALPVDAGGGGCRVEGRRGRGRGPMVAAHQSRHLGADPRGIRARPASAARALSPPVGGRGARGDPGGRRGGGRRGRLPQEVRHLLDIVEIKGLCRQAGIEQIDAGPKGAVIAFRNKSFANPEGLIAFIREEGKQVKLQPDHRLIYFADWETPEERLV